jgi:hypothetical protein
MKESKIKTVPNQHIVVVHREDTGKQFIAINKHNFTKAYRDMSNASAALALYIWLVGNQNNYRFAFSPKAIENQLGMAISSCQGAFKKLEDLGYLVPRGDDSNVYDFHEVSIDDQKRERKLIDVEKLEFEEMPTTINFPIAKPGEFHF